MAFNDFNLMAKCQSGICLWVIWFWVAGLWSFGDAAEPDIDNRHVTRLGGAII
jgi:hypothetical protein